MFGHDDKHQEDDELQHDGGATQEQEVSPDQPVDGGQDGQGQGDHAQGSGSDGSNSGQHDDDAGDNPGSGDNPSDNGAWQHPGDPIDAPADDSGATPGSDDKPAPINDILPGSGQEGGVPHMPAPPRNLTDDTGGDSKLPHELIDIKQKALGELSPLMPQLDLGPEDKFRTLMMMIQANDDQDLIKQAYEAAEAIEDEKIRAQALFEIVNEITYFTQHQAEN